MSMTLDGLKATLTDARAEIQKVIIGQDTVIDMALITIFTGNHALIEGVPGVAKTLLVRTLACILDLPFNRIQFTPDLMPTDITGTNIYDTKRQEFALIKGPVFTGFLLADEINRAPAKTQSALPQCMQERRVTIDRETHVLDENFTVFATQNPVEYEGTYPLPEAQKDRFMLKIPMDYPALDDEVMLASRMLGSDPPEARLHSGTIQRVVQSSVLPQLRESLQAITVREELVRYIVDLVRATRQSEYVLVGAGPRATQALILATRCWAALQGRDFVTPDDVKYLAVPVLGHRLVLRPEYEIEGASIADLVDQILQKLVVPV